MIKEIELNVGSQTLYFQLLSQSDLSALSQQVFLSSMQDNKIVNIFASGASILDVHFDEFLLQTPSLFVNGSISLLGEHKFIKPTCYVVSDERFISHNLDVILNHYQGMLFCMTLPVLQALIAKAPDFVQQNHLNFRLIFAIDKPIVKKTGLLSRIFQGSQAFQLQKISIDIFKTQPKNAFIFDFNHEPIIGSSLDITQGFVEAGTVAFVATQLAFGLKPNEIHLYGIDLVNSNQPRFYETEQNKAPIKLDKAIQNRIVPSFDLIAQSYQAQQVKLINHSAISKNLFQQIQYLP